LWANQAILKKNRRLIFGRSCILLQLSVVSGEKLGITAQSLSCVFVDSMMQIIDGQQVVFVIWKFIIKHAIG
tara:strand:- start:391 stop:606 length:216 start_codon:yes stop_codon:yes gene_type:complete